MKTKHLFFNLFFVFLIITSCQKDDAIDAITNQKVLTEEHIEFLNALEINPDEATIESIKNLEGISQDYIVIRDIEIPLEEFDVWKANKNSGNPGKQYRSKNIVAAAYRNITVVADSKLPYNKIEGLKLAIDEYNRLGTSLKMTLKYEGSGDIDVYNSRFIGDNEAKAGFPSWRGKPYHRIRTNPRNDNIPITALKTLYMHELGHCFGLRHQDYKTHSSCLDYSDIELGVVTHIPGTPTSEYEPSVMLTCMYGPYGPITGFSDSDKRALNILY